MSVRLGEALYFLFMLIGGLLMAFGAYMWSIAPDALAPVVIFAVAGLVAWAIGRGCRYVLSGN